MKGVDQLINVQQCRTCREVVYLKFSSGYEDDRRFEHDHPGHKSPANLRQACHFLDPIEIGPGGLQRAFELRRARPEQERRA